MGKAERCGGLCDERCFSCRARPQRMVDRQDNVGTTIPPRFRQPRGLRSERGGEKRQSYAGSNRDVFGQVEGVVEEEVEGGCDSSGELLCC